MKIKKIGHCCLVIDIDGVRVLTDPGRFSIDEYADITGVNIILLTHEHADHLHTESLSELLENNPESIVLTNSGVGKLLDEAGIAYEVLEGRESQELSGVLLEAYDAKHAEIFEEYGQVQNTGYFIQNKLFYPGDAYCNPGKQVDVLALPVAGPWCKIKDALDYAMELNPNVAFPVHDAIERQDRVDIIHNIAGAVLSEHNIEFTPMKSGDEREF
jgi:L-ascorbate metabolism protein UlaG (beta-lactamase superfamily)